MGAIICRQPNGRLCRFSTITDSITHYNLTDNEYIEICKDRAVNEAKDTINNHLMPFTNIEKYFIPNNMSAEDFNKILREMSTPIHDVIEVKQSQSKQMIHRRAWDEFRNNGLLWFINTILPYVRVGDSS